MANFIDLDKRADLVDAIADLFSSCHFRHTNACLPPDCRECLNRFFDNCAHLIPIERIPTSENTRAVVLCKNCALRGTSKCAMSWENENGRLMSWSRDFGYCDYGVEKSSKQD